MFAYEVMTEQQAMSERFQLLPDGDYQGVITSSVDTISAKSGNPMMDMIVSVYDKNGKEYPIRDFLVFTSTMMWKVIHCAESSNLLRVYQDKGFCSAMIRGCSVTVRITTEKGSEIPVDKLNGKLPGSTYPDKNKIQDYLPSINVKKEIKHDNDEFLNDAIPF